VIAAADGNPDDVVAELEVTSVAESSAVSDVRTPKRTSRPVTWLTCHLTTSKLREPEHAQRDAQISDRDFVH
jgi:hypothetical protein